MRGNLGMELTPSRRKACDALDSLIADPLVCLRHSHLGDRPSAGLGPGYSPSDDAMPSCSAMASGRTPCRSQCSGPGHAAASQRCEFPLTRKATGVLVAGVGGGGSWPHDRATKIGSLGSCSACRGGCCPPQRGHPLSIIVAFLDAWRDQSVYLAFQSHDFHHLASKGGIGCRRVTK